MLDRPAVVCCVTSAQPKGCWLVTNAVDLCEVQGAKIVDQLDLSSSCNPYFCQSQHLPMAVVDKLKQMHEFLTDYMRHTTIEQ